VATLPNRRVGFTLIELLVVISLIGTLAALSVGAFMRVRAGQTKVASETTLQKLNTALDNRWKVILESVKEDHKKNQGQWPFALIAANGNPDAAESLLLYAKAKNELPMTFAEAKAPTTVTTAYGMISLPPKAVFNTLPISTATSPEESGACFYLAVLSNAGGGAMLDSDGLQQQSTDYTGAGWNVSARLFKDAWGTPIAFVRMAYTPELNAPPYIKAGQLRDPNDPAGKLPAIMSALAWGQLTANTPPFAGIPGTYPAATQNFVPTLVSAGPNKLWEPSIFAGSNNDNLLSYRLRREGGKGD